MHYRIRRSVAAIALAGLSLVATPLLAAEGGTGTTTPPVERPVGNADTGKRLFATQCGTCHSFDPAKKLYGPHLKNIINRKSASLEGFEYSAGMKAANLTWTEDQLYLFLKDPKALIPGTVKVVKVPNAQQRADIIAYLKRDGGVTPAP